jgi:hypothetical protein
MMKAERELRRTAKDSGYEIVGTPTKAGLYDLRHKDSGLVVRCRAPSDAYSRSRHNLAHRLKHAAEAPAAADHPLPVRKD